jgi:MoxR-like ATPase
MARHSKKEHGLSRPQVRVVLDYMGIPFNQHGSNAAEIHARFEIEKQNNPAKYQEAIDIIVHHKKPEPVEIKSNTLYKEFGGLIDNYFDDELGRGAEAINNHLATICDMLDEKGSDMWRTLAQEVSNEIEKAKEEFKVTAVKVGNQKPRKIDGVIHDQFERILQLAQQRKNIMLVGPAGCGKTHLASQIAQGLGLDYSSQSCTAGMSESMLTGWLLPIEKSGQFVYVQSEFIRIYENGGVFLLDEMDAADPNVLVFINQALANKQFTLPQRFEKPLVKQHKDFVCIAACNTFGSGADAMYHGRNALDAATLDRFKVGMISMDYSEEIERKLVSPEVLTWGLSIRNTIDNHKLRRVMSTRFLRDATDMVESQDWTMEDVKQAYFSDWSKEEIRMCGGAA